MIVNNPLGSVLLAAMKEVSQELVVEGCRVNVGADVYGVLVLTQLVEVSGGLRLPVGVCTVMRIGLGTHGWPGFDLVKVG